MRVDFYKLNSSVTEASEYYQLVSNIQCVTNL